ncbi:alpha/beta fold hydrolase [Methanobacterium sp.]|uniref:alpha/beta fold hydrolase n=1 Tax=Methanobacterium sp. TaxID=2164 RepID=UPI003C727B1A
MPNIKIDDVNMYYEVHGEGEPLVLITGLSSDHKTWLPFLPAFTNNYRVLIMDNRGIGQTEYPDTQFSVDDMADDTAGLMNKLGIEKAHVIGHSLGGRIAQKLVLKYPEKVKSLILCATSASQPKRSKLMLNTLANEVNNGMSIGALLKIMMAISFTENSFQNVDIINERIDSRAEGLSRDYAKNFARQVQASADYNTVDELNQIKVPTLVLAAEYDFIFPLEFVKELAEGISGSKLIVIEGTGHSLLLEEPKEFIKLTLGFLSKINK